MSKKRKWRLTLTEPQLRLIARCIEDCSRFASGQTEMSNTVGYLPNSTSARDVLRTVKPIVAPELEPNASYGWNGGSCPRILQHCFIAKTYYLYREILHCLTVERNKEEDMSWNVYLGKTLRCADSGEPIKLEVVDETDQD